MPDEDRVTLVTVSVNSELGARIFHNYINAGDSHSSNISKIE